MNNRPTEVPKIINPYTVKLALVYYYSDAFTDLDITDFEVNEAATFKKERELGPCPLCKGELTLVRGTSDDSGRNSDPCASCTCGFYYHPDYKIADRAGENGWDYIKRKHREIESHIYMKLGKVR